MFQLWLDLLHRQRVAFWMHHVDETSVMKWHPSEIEGVPNIPGC